MRAKHELYTFATEIYIKSKPDSFEEQVADDTLSSLDKGLSVQSIGSTLGAISEACLETNDEEKAVVAGKFLQFILER